MQRDSGVGRQINWSFGLVREELTIKAQLNQCLVLTRLSQMGRVVSDLNQGLRKEPLQVRAPVPVRSAGPDQVSVCAGTDPEEETKKKRSSNLVCRICCCHGIALHLLTSPWKHKTDDWHGAGSEVGQEHLREVSPHSFDISFIVLTQDHMRGLSGMLHHNNRETSRVTETRG